MAHVVDRDYGGRSALVVLWNVTGIQVSLVFLPSNNIPQPIGERTYIQQNFNNIKNENF